MKTSKRCLALLVITIMIISVMPALSVSAASYTQDFSGSAWASVNFSSGTKYFDNNGAVKNAFAANVWKMYAKNTISGAGGKLTITGSSANSYVMYKEAEAFGNKVVITMDLTLSGFAAASPEMNDMISVIGKDNTGTSSDNKFYNIVRLYGGEVILLGESNADHKKVHNAVAGEPFRIEITLDYDNDTKSARVAKWDSEAGNFGEYGKSVSNQHTKTLAAAGIKIRALNGTAGDLTITVDNISIADWEAPAAMGLDCEVAASGNTTIAETTFTAGAFEGGSVYLVTALYGASDKLLQVVAETKELNEGTASHTANFTAAGGEYVKVFAWDATDKLTPIVASETFDLN